MSYKIENGKIYEVKEINAADLEKEVKQAVAFVEQHKSALAPFESEITLKKAELNRLITKYEDEIKLLQDEVNKHYAAIETAKSSVSDKKEIIEQLYPDAKNILGF